ncbi:hypothetical protein Rhe02_06650 [Rhizocola hellebori]|uniref:Uncharacterized protein n=1 Tax=Rhizocola hellebori TaxID=1392758 RepID=A0A8J3Q2D7_9ACTN|nr:hypothetical protein Rhe02_06650 [Rhizocola hellebori]
MAQQDDKRDGEPIERHLAPPRSHSGAKRELTEDHPGREQIPGHSQQATGAPDNFGIQQRPLLAAAMALPGLLA